MAVNKVKQQRLLERLRAYAINTGAPSVVALVEQLQHACDVTSDLARVERIKTAKELPEDKDES